MRDFGRTIPEALILEDKVFVEYHASSSSAVTLHYIIEKGNEKKLSYITCRLYPTYGGVFSKAFTLFEGEKMTYFITEKREDGSEVTTPSVTMEKAAAEGTFETRYERINKIRQLIAQGREKELMNKMQQYQYLDDASEQLFVLK